MAGFYRKGLVRGSGSWRFQAQYGRDLAVLRPDEFMDITKSSSGGRGDRQPPVYGAAIFTGASERITMGATSVLYPFGFKYEPAGQNLRYGRRGQFRGFGQGPRNSTNSSTNAARLRSYTNSHMEAPFKSRQVAMMMNWFAFMPAWPGTRKSAR